MANQPERVKVTNKVLRFLRTVPRCKLIKIHGSAYMESGTPDIFALVQGTLFCVECKVPGEHPDPIQAHRLAQWMEAGAVPVVAHGVEDVRRALVGAGKSVE